MTQGTRKRGSARRAELDRGRDAYARKAWADAREAFARADGVEPLGPEDLERLAWSAAMLGRDVEMMAALDRVHAASLEAGDRSRAARAAFWVGFRLLSLGELAKAGGWFGRAERLRDPRDEVLRGWLAFPEVYRFQRSGREGDLDRAFELAGSAAEAGERARDHDLIAFARAQQAVSRLRQGRTREGLALLDEAMLAATSHALRPIVTGLVYCSAIAGCSRVYALDRARVWTQTLSSWCASQPQLVTFAGTCLVHRAEVLELGGSWRAALDEARRVASDDAVAAGAGAYQQGEIHRLMGEHERAEQAYLAASRAGRDPQPGLSLLRLAQGRVDAALKAIARAVYGTADRLQRSRLLPAQVEILLAAGKVDEARGAAAELAESAALIESPVLSAIADHAGGAVRVAGGDPASALPLLRRALEAWLELEVPYLAARARALAGRATAALGDAEGARLEIEAARAVFAKLGAVTDLSRLDGSVHVKGKLTMRELQVLRLVAAGRTNGAIARELALAEKTIDRHVSNIFDKLEVSSRAAATARGFRDGLL